MNTDLFDGMVKLIGCDAPKKAEGDYTGEDGLLYCGKCHTRKQRKLQVPEFFGSGERIVPVMCDCAKAEFEAEEAAKKHREDVARAQAQETAKKIAGKVISISARGAEGGRLYGSVTSQEIADALEKQYGVKVEKRRIDVKNIRNAGEYTVNVWLYAGITAEMTAKVEVAAQ